jgi:2-polyprenyl-3-methyl-5-hydroxy-6-metoxy-1,4-benzoquinol methylase
LLSFFLDYRIGDVTKISWKKGTAAITCRLCGFTGVGKQVLRLVTSGRITINPVECPRCLSLDVLPEPIHFSQTDLEVDAYVEAGVGIDAIASMVSSMPRDSVTNFVDVGCGYGFSLAVAQDICGWRAMGFEPSPLGVAGARALGVKIRNEFFGQGTQLDGSPDFILSSEVVEHVPDPLTFIQGLRSQMSARCVLLLTTPNRAVVYPEFPLAVSEMALSPGFHAFVASAAGMRALLRRAGFIHINVRVGDGTLFVSASRSASALALVTARDVSRSELESWYASACDRAEPGSSLRIALGRRLLDSLVATGNFVDAVERAQKLHVDLNLRYGSGDLGHLVREATTGSSSLSLSSVASLAYGLGIIALLAQDDAEKASQDFATSIDAVRKWLRLGLPPNYHLLSIARESRINQLIALARFNAEDAQSAVSNDFDLVDIDRNYLAARVLVEAVSRGYDDSVRGLAQVCGDSVDDLIASESGVDRVAGQDALYMLAGMNERDGAVEAASGLYVRCIEACFASSTVASHEITLIHAANEALCRLGHEPHTLAQEFLLRTTFPAPIPTTHFAIESYWRDASGVFIEGWAHLGSTPVTAITVEHNGVECQAETKARSDLNEIFPGLPSGLRAGFRAYVPGGRGESVNITLSTSQGNIAIRWIFPLHPLPEGDSPQSEAFAHEVGREVENAPDGPVLAIGIRTDNAEKLAQIRELFGNREVVSLDIHAGPGANVVGDIHNLRALFPDESFSIVYSDSVLEHLAMPWVAALEMLRVLKPGGIMAHSVPWVWPSHAQPNDFFRFSIEGLQTLFSAEIGCETIAVGEADFVRVLPDSKWRSPSNEEMPTLVSPGRTWIITKKISAAAALASWPYDHKAGQGRASEYPIDGIERQRDS